MLRFTSHKCGQMNAETEVFVYTPAETLSPLLSFLVHFGLLEQEENFYHQTPAFSPKRYPPQHHLLHHPHHHCPKLKGVGEWTRDHTLVVDISAKRNY